MKFLEVIKDSLLDDYRKSNKVNYSLLKEMIDGNYTVIRDGLPEKTSIYMDFGSYIDKVITEKDPPNVYTYKHTELSGHSKTLVDHLISTNSINIPIEDRLVRANNLNLWASTKKEDKRLALVNTEDINTILNREIARKEGKDIISEEDLELANKILDVLYTHAYSKNIIKPPLKIESYTQLPLAFKFNGIECKVLLDFLQINHKDKTIRPIDLKTGSKKDFLKNYWGFKYWLQATLYYLAVVSLKKYKELKDYTILPFTFLYISRENPYLPLKFELDEKSIEKYTTGYKDYKGEYKKGVIDYLSDYKFYKETDIYDISREIYENKGIIELPKPY